MALFCRYVLLDLLVMALLFGFLSTAPTTNKTLEHWDAITDLKLVTTTTPTPERAELSCEKTIEDYDTITSFAMEQTIEKLVSEYNDWGKLLAPAPVAIGILGQLILLANQVKDFPINNKDPSQGFKYIKYPNSFKTTLLQISQSGFNSFLKAHRNMDAIRLHNDAVPNDIKDAVRYIASENTRVIGLRLPDTLNRIKEAAEKSQELAKEVVDEFNLVLGLIDETELAVKYTKTEEEIRLEDVNFNMELKNNSKEISEKESLILMKKDAKMKRMMVRLEKKQDLLYIRTRYNGDNFTVNLAKDWVQEIGKERYKQDEKYLNDATKTRRYTYFNKFIESNSCAQNNSDQLLDLLMAFKQYRTSYIHWQNSIRKSRVPFDPTEVINTFEQALGNLKNCTETDVIIKKGYDLTKIMKNSNTLKSKMTNRKASLPYENEINEITTSIYILRREANKVKQKSNKQVELKTNSVMEIYEISKRHQLSQLKSMSKTIQDILNLNNEMMKIRRQKTLEILDKLANLNITKVRIENVMEILREGLEELGKLKNHWGELIQFFDKIRTFVESASRHSTGLVEIVGTLSKNPSLDMKDTFLLSELKKNFEKSNEAVLLVHGIADMYVNVSNIYIMNRLAKLNTMNSMRIERATNEELKQIKENMTMDATEASKGIEAYIQNHEKELNNELQTRHRGILREYEKMLHCIRSHGTTDFAVNFTGADTWFQIQSKINGKVVEVSSENPNLVQIWESHGGDNQLWYQDEEFVIRSVTTGFCLTSNRTNRVNVEPCQENDTNQKWTFEDGMIVNTVKLNRILDIYNRENINGAPITEVEIDETASKLELWETLESSLS